ncbi:hypothetical protein [Pseudomonas asiatica]|uniref:hypothetical protein n=1 Tax=Pseudomonas asiatica TaxID=2219225 RepID=UPI002AC938A7|nr:hypothetical protein [Pseudomonas asiatica]WPX87679.1 hypothetical protein PsasTeo6_15096 [Pseudomonas asiatica]
MPTENRSSNTEMVSVSRALIERLEQFGEGSTPGRTVRKDALEQLYASCTQPAEQHQGEPVAWQVTWPDGSCELYAHEAGAKASMAPYRPLYTHTDPSDVRVTKQALESLKGETSDLRAQLAKREELLRDLEGKTILSWPDKRRISAALSASAEPIAPIAWHVGGNGYDRICFEEPTDLPGRPCIQAIHDQRQLIKLLKRYDLRDEDVPPDERAHGIPAPPSSD